ncbi:MAG: hypothetical protein PHF89_05405 [Eubacteriales bacterium]|jgi:hypothetical protein|nr:hypothetical protein [Eubacteriales bacterium]
MGHNRGIFGGNNDWIWIIIAIIIILGLFNDNDQDNCCDNCF